MKTQARYCCWSWTLHRLFRDVLTSIFETKFESCKVLSFIWLYFFFNYFIKSIFNQHLLEDRTWSHFPFWFQIQIRRELYTIMHFKTQYRMCFYFVRTRSIVYNYIWHVTVTFKLIHFFFRRWNISKLFCKILRCWKKHTNFNWIKQKEITKIIFF